jgi:hypothetical protein
MSMMIKVVSAQMLKSIGTDLDQNLIKPSNTKIEQKRIFSNKLSDDNKLQTGIMFQNCNLAIFKRILPSSLLNNQHKFRVFSFMMI